MRVCEFVDSSKEIEGSILDFKGEEILSALLVGYNSRELFRESWLNLTNGWTWVQMFTQRIGFDLWCLAILDES
jgi:hypothetical protein